MVCVCLCVRVPTLVLRLPRSAPCRCVVRRIAILLACICVHACFTPSRCCPAQCTLRCECVHVYRVYMQATLLPVCNDVLIVAHICVHTCFRDDVLWMRVASAACLGARCVTMLLLTLLLPLLVCALSLTPSLVCCVYVPIGVRLPTRWYVEVCSIVGV